MRLHILIFRYLVFAILATFVNLSVQRIIFWYGDSNSIFALALALGGAMGLVVKYILDKRWVFEDIRPGVEEHSKKFPLYILMGVFSTLIFWVTETIFWLTWKTDLMREVGAIIGLSIGYVVKYNLDRRYVFNDSKLSQAS